MHTHQTQHTHVSLGGRGILVEVAGFGTNNISGCTATSGAISIPRPPGS